MREPRRSPSGAIGALQDVISATRIAASSTSETARIWLKSGDGAARIFPGYLGSQIVQLTVPQPGWQITFAFSNARDFHRWETSDERKKWLRKAEDQDLAMDYLTVWGIASDKSLSASRRATSPPRWKQTIIIYISFLPLSLLMNYGLSCIPAELPLWTKVATSVAVLTPLMTYIFIPWVSKGLASWLTPREITDLPRMDQ